jgi:hypothetical protein
MPVSGVLAAGYKRGWHMYYLLRLLRFVLFLAWSVCEHPSADRPFPTIVRHTVLFFQFASVQNMPRKSIVEKQNVYQQRLQNKIALFNLGFF